MIKLQRSDRNSEGANPKYTSRQSQFLSFYKLSASHLETPFPYDALFDFEYIYKLYQTVVYSLQSIRIHDPNIVSHILSKQAVFQLAC